jgi:uncharacterized protein YecE (DUF72 family)
MSRRPAPAPEVAAVRTGTMGWSYDDWRGPFYPADLPAAKMLETFGKVFDTVEIDSTFYGVPRASTLSGWAAQVPPGFLFSAKTPRAVTHERRLLGAAGDALSFGALLRERLGARLGALLLQLPPDFTADERPAFDAFVDALTSPRGEPGLPWVVEFRDASWAETDVVARLDAAGVACATTERLDLGGPLRYIRLLGTENAVPRFDAPVIDRKEDVAAWAVRFGAARSAPGAADPILVYVRNFFEGHAPATLLALRAALGLSVPVPPGKQQMSLF